MTSKSKDTFFDGQVVLQQPSDGYRHSIDPVLLVHFCCPNPNDRVLDLGTGNGIIPVILAYRYKNITISAVEIQPSLHQLAKENVAANHLQSRVTLHLGDIKQLSTVLPSKCFNLVVSNPPYIECRSGRVNPNRKKAIARHEIEITLKEVLFAAYTMLSPMGRFAIVYPASRLTDLLCFMRRCNLEPKRLRWIHGRADLDAKRVLIEGRKHGKPGLKVTPPLVIYKEDGTYTNEVNRMFLP